MEGPRCGFVTDDMETREKPRHLLGFLLNRATGRDADPSKIRICLLFPSPLFLNEPDPSVRRLSPRQVLGSDGGSRC
jgi:hypothetical protein